MLPVSFTLVCVKDVVTVHYGHDIPVVPGKPSPKSTTFVLQI